jgi:hypothetical protein
MVTPMDDGQAMLDKIFAMVEAGDPKGNVYRPFTDQESLKLIEAAGTVRSTRWNIFNLSNLVAMAGARLDCGTSHYGSKSCFQ